MCKCVFPTLSTGAQGVGGSFYGKPDKAILLSNMGCTGDEFDLDDCSFISYSLTEGKSLQDVVQVAGVACLPKDCIPPKVQGSDCTIGSVGLEPGSGVDGAGNLQYCYNGTWSYFCNLDQTAASVACRQLGYQNYDCKYMLRERERESE